MKRRHRPLAMVALAAAFCTPLAGGQTPAPPEPPQASAPQTAAPQSPQPPTPPQPIGEMKPLGKDRFQIGHIVVDKRARRFSVPGRVHVLGKALEYLAASPKGMKLYETLLELDATGSEFNLACILLGLERPQDQAPFQRYSRQPLAGERAALYIAWSEGKTRRKISAGEALHNPQTGAKATSIEWVYLGSPASRPGGPFAADVTGVLIGFVHDPTAVIESVGGVGIGAYGSVQGNSALPPVGSPIELIVEVPRARK